jgi:hypothetical protein
MKQWEYFSEIKAESIEKTIAEIYRKLSAILQKSVPLLDVEIESFTDKLFSDNQSLENTPFIKL